MSPLESATVAELFDELEKRCSTYVFIVEGEHGRLRMGGHITHVLGLVHRARIIVESDLMDEMDEMREPGDDEDEE